MFRSEPGTNTRQDPGQYLRAIRERLRLKYRDVEEASAKIAENQGSDQFQLGLSRLADIENRGTIPSIYRIYSLCAIYRLDFRQVLVLYGVDLGDLGSDTASTQLDFTNVLDSAAIATSSARAPLLREEEPDLRRTLFLTKQMVRWGRVPLTMLEGLDVDHQRYAFIGLRDWFMYPLLRPGSFVQIDESRKKISSGGWANEWERPIYLLEHHEGYRCAWCSVREEVLIAQPHPASNAAPETYAYPGRVDVLGQVVGVAMRIHPGMRPHTHFSGDPE